MPLLETLPVELLLSIIRHLPLQPLHRFRRVSKLLNYLISDNEALVYRQAAALHGYVESINSNIDPPSEQSKNPTYPFTNTASWKQYCQFCLELDRNWAGQGSAAPQIYCARNADVHRIKVDEEHALLFTSHEVGGITVTDLHSGEILWTLPQNYVRTHAHLEYENGFLIFDRFDSDKEVWRLATDFDPSQTPPHAGPDSSQRLASLLADARYPTTRGHLKPWCLISTSQPTFAYRFAYPTLIVMSMDTAYLWDVPSATLVQTIHDVEEPFVHDDGDGDEHATISYVDISARHLFVCGWHELRVFNRSDGSLAMRIPSRPTFADARILLSHERRGAPTAVVPIGAHILPPLRPNNRPLPSFVAAHVSRCGRHLVAMLADNRLLLLEDFERVARGQVSLAEAALELNITLPENAMFIGVYLAYEFGRVSVVTTSGVYIFTLDATAHLLMDPSTPPGAYDSLPLGLIRPSSPTAPALPLKTSFRHLAGAYLPRMRNKHVLINLSCLQISATRLYLTWDRRRADILERLPDGAAAGGWRFDLEADNMDMYDDMLEDEATLPPGPIMELHAEFGAVVLCLDFRPAAARVFE